MLKKELANLYHQTTTFNEQFREVQIALHNVDKTGVNVEHLYKQLDNIGTELYLFRELVEKEVEERISK